MEDHEQRKQIVATTHDSNSNNMDNGSVQLDLCTDIIFFSC